LRPDELQAQAWMVVEPHFQQAQAEVLSLYHRLAGTGRTSNELREILPAASHGRVEYLFVAIGVQQWGALDPHTDTLQAHQEAQPGDEDLLDLAARLTLSNSGTVYALEPGAVPGDAALAAIFRY
jgi:hypothetical protein